MKEQSKLKTRRRMEIIDTRAEINKSENKNNRERSVKPKGDF